jgi:hypothetical protein
MTRPASRAPASRSRPARADPWCFGVFVDNELPWGASVLSGRHAPRRLPFPPGGRARQARRRGLLRAALRRRRRRLQRRVGSRPGLVRDLQQLTSITTCPLVDPIADDACLKSEPAQRRADRMASRRWSRVATLRSWRGRSRMRLPAS